MDNDNEEIVPHGSSAHSTHARVDATADLSNSRLRMSEVTETTMKTTRTFTTEPPGDDDED